MNDWRRSLISEITQWIMELMRAHGQLSVFIGVMIEQIIVPIPSPLIIMGAGAILIPPELSIPNAFLQILWIIVLPGSIASTLGSYIGYLISYYGGKALVVRFQRFLDVDWKQIENLEKRFRGKERSIEYLSCHGPFRSFPSPWSPSLPDSSVFPSDPSPFTPFWVPSSDVSSSVFLDGGSGRLTKRLPLAWIRQRPLSHILMLIGMGVVFVYLYYKFRKSA